MQPDPAENLEARLQSLEVTNRWLKGGLLVCACLAFVSLFRAAPQPDPTVIVDIVRTRKLEVVNRNGKTVVVSSPIGETGGILAVGSNEGTVSISAHGNALNVAANRVKSQEYKSSFVLSCKRNSTSLNLQHGDETAELVATRGVNGVEVP